MQIYVNYARIQAIKKSANWQSSLSIHILINNQRRLSSRSAAFFSNMPPSTLPRLRRLVGPAAFFCDARLPACAAMQSGDSSVVTRWTVDQEVVGSNPTHGGNLISVVRSLSGFTQPIR